jgi:hypothetical protein
MLVLDYNAIRDHLTTVIEETGLQVSVEETVIVSSMLRECSILVFPAIDGPEVWGKITFEWAPENQVILDDYVSQAGMNGSGETSEDLDANQIIVHIEFHIHFAGLVVNSEVVSGVAQNMKQTVDEYFGGDGRVFAEVYMDSADAKIDCLRYEKHTMYAFITDELWWEQMGVGFQGVLAHLTEIYERLGTLFGS